MPVRVEDAGVPEGGNLEVERQILAETMEVVHHVGLVGTIQMIEIVDL